MSGTANDLRRPIILGRYGVHIDATWILAVAMGEWTGSFRLLISTTANSFFLGVFISLYT